MRLVLDTNVLVSAALNRTGTPRRLLNRWLIEAAYELVVSAQLLDELDDVLHRPKFASLISKDEASALVAKLRTDAAVAEDPIDPPALVRDPDDDFLIAMAVVAEATALVSGDQDLLELDDPPVPIWTVSEALERLG